MQTAKPSTAGTARRAPSHPIYINEGLSPKKTAFIIVTVIGCIAILWPKVFYPMMFGGNGATTTPKSNYKEQRGPGGLRQERPAHLHPDSIYQAMKERGRAIPATQTIPIVDRKGSPSNPPPRIVEGRPGPIPGMRPPMGAGALHQPQAKGSSMGFIMPLYTIGIIVFFGYTLMKIVFKKPVPNAPYGPAPVDPNFRKEVFGHESDRHVEDLHGTKLVVTAIQGLIDAADEQLKLRENSTTRDIPKISNENSTSNNGNIHGHTYEHKGDETGVESVPTTDKTNDKEHHKEDQQQQQQQQSQSQPQQQQQQQQQRKRREGSAERSVTVLGMEVTASCEGGHKWKGRGRPPTPVFFLHNENTKSDDEDDELPEPQSIYLEGSLAHESQILVSDSETKREEVYDEELNGSPEEPAVILSSKMTLSLINLDSNQLNENDTENKNDIESPLADDIEIIGHDEN